jgi:hypothetical protein
MCQPIYLETWKLTSVYGYYIHPFESFAVDNFTRLGISTVINFMKEKYLVLWDKAFGEFDQIMDIHGRIADMWGAVQLVGKH